MAIAFLIAPNMGIIDSWLPVLTTLSDKKERLLAFIPDENVLRNIDTADVALQLANPLFSKVYVKSWYGEWQSYGTLIEAHQKACWRTPLIIKALYRIASYLPFFQKLPTNLPTARSSLTEILPHIRAVLFDVGEVCKPYLQIFITRLADTNWYSLPHGINPLLYRDDKVISPAFRHASRLSNLRVYIATEIEREFYKKKHSLKDDQLKLNGVTRHQPKWIEYLQSRDDTSIVDQAPYIFVVSRPANNLYFSPSRKMKALAALRRLAEDLQYKLVIRRHPKENDRALFDNVLGRESEGSLWMFSEAHPLVLGKKSQFCVTFLSSVTIDMAALSVPIIQLFDCTGLEHDPQFLYDDDGNLVTKYQKLGLVLAARNEKELKAHARTIMENRHRVASQQHEQYKKIYAAPDGAIERIVSDIENALSSDE